MSDKLYNAILSAVNPYFYLKVKEGQTETGNRESYYGKIPQDDRCTFDISNNKILINILFFIYISPLLVLTKKLINIIKF